MRVVETLMTPPPVCLRKPLVVGVFGGVLVAVALVAGCGASTGGASPSLEASGSTTSATTPTASTSTTPAEAARKGTVSEVVDPPNGGNCQGLRSRIAWASTGTPDEIGAAAGGQVSYVETFTNEGTETCTRVFERCHAPGALFTSEEEPAPRTTTPCTSMGHEPVELAPGQSRQDVFSADLFTKPGDYELRVSGHDGRIATLPIRLEPEVPSCAPGSLALDQQPFEVFVFGNDTTFSQSSVDAGQQFCTIRIAETRLALRPAGDPAAPERTFLDGAGRWYATNSTDPGRTYVEATFGPVDLLPGQYEGSIAIQLENGETLRRLARLLVG